MKLTKILSYSGLLLVAGMFVAGCKKERGKEVAFEDYDYSNKALVQVINSVLVSARNYVYVDSRPVNGASLAYGGAFPSTPGSFAIASGYRNFLIRDTSNTTTQAQMSFAQNFEPGANYTIFTYDTITQAKQKTVRNNLVIPDDTTARIRFANFIYSPSLVPAFDIYSKRLNANIFTNVNLTDVTEFIPYASRITDTFYIRVAGTTTNLQNYRPPTSTVAGALVDIIAILNPAPKRSYTLVFRGGYRATNTTLPTAFTTANPSVRTLAVYTHN